MKSISDYKELIAQMPVQEQSFITKRSTWFGKIDDKILDRIFEGEDAIKISRQSIFLTCNISDFIYKVVMWGYPRGMQGRINDKLIFERIATIIPIVNNPNRGKYSEDDVESVLMSLFALKGLGISTVSKFLYFRTHQYGVYKSLILDERIMRVFNNNIFEEFSEVGRISPENGRKKYLDYLKVMHKTAGQMEVEPDKLEMFLFTFGNNI